MHIRIVQAAVASSIFLCCALTALSVRAVEASPPTTAGTIVETAEKTRPLPVGSTMPDVEVQTLAGKTVKLSQVTDGKPAALIFYRGGWCPFCNTHLQSLKDAVAPLKELGVQLVAVAPDLPAELAKTSEKQVLDYTLISDAKMNAAKALGIAFRVDDETVEKYKGYGIDLEAVSGETHHALPVPAVVLLDAAGKIRFLYANPDYKVRLENEKLLAAAKEVAAR